MPKSPTKPNLTGSLEDYLETIMLLARRGEPVRVKDIAAERGVRAPSVSLALGKLADLGLLTYARREFIELTPTGLTEARRVYSRHQILSRFFEEILRMDPAAASDQACALEHALTDDGMDRLARFFEYLAGCPSVPRGFLKDYGQCPIVSGDGDSCGPHADSPFACITPCHSRTDDQGGERQAVVRLSDQPSGTTGVVTQIDAQGAVRRKLLDMGLLPDVKLTVERAGTGGKSIGIKVGVCLLTLTVEEAQAVCLVPS